MRPSMTRSIWLLILAGSLLAGCTASASPPPASSGLLPAEGRTPAAGSAPTGTLAVADPFSTVTPQAEQSEQFLPALENQSAANPTQTQPAVESPTATPPSSRKEIKAGLEASDPNAAQLASGKVQLVEFFAFWWGTCRSMAPIVHGLEAEYGEQMNFVYLDIDDPDTDPFKSALGYRVQPHLFLVDEHGKIIQQWLGRVSEADLRQAFEAALD